MKNYLKLKENITHDYFWVQTLGTFCILLNWWSVAFGASDPNPPWYVLAYPLNLVAESIGMVLWIWVALYWKNVNVLFLKSYILVACIVAVSRFYFFA